LLWRAAHQESAKSPTIAEYIGSSSTTTGQEYENWFQTHITRKSKCIQWASGSLEVEEDLTFETFVANNIKRLVLSHLFDDQLHHISVLGAFIARIKLNVVVARNYCQLQFNLASTNLQPKSFSWSVDLLKPSLIFSIYMEWRPLHCSTHICISSLTFSI
jgi:hypothetical protein